MSDKDKKTGSLILIFFSLVILFGCSIVYGQSMSPDALAFVPICGIGGNLMPFVMFIIGIGVGILIRYFFFPRNQLEADNQKLSILVSSFVIIIGLGVIFFIVSMLLMWQDDWTDFIGFF